MQGKDIHILCTRKLDRQLIDKAAANGVQITAHSFIHTTPVSAEQIKQAIARCGNKGVAVFTSARAVEAVADCMETPLQWQVFCTSGATLTAVGKKLGDATILAVAPNAKTLANSIMKHRGISEVHFFCGDMHLPYLPAMLSDNHIAVHNHIVYNTSLTPKEITQHYDGIIFFSPSAVKSFLSKNEIAGDTVLFSMGSTTTESLSQFKNNIIQSSAVSAVAMIDTVIKYYKPEFLPVR